MPNTGLLHTTVTGVQQQVGVREELADFIAVVDAKSTPFSSMIPKGKDLGNMLFDWQVDNYDVVRLGGVVDGADVAVASLTNASANRARFKNYAQVFQRNFRVGFIADQMNVAGVADEVARSVSKRMLELKRDIEATLLLANQAAQADDGTLPYMTGSLGNWLGAAALDAIGKPTHTAYQLPALSKYTGKASSAITEVDVQDMLTSIYSQTGQIRSYDAVVGPTLKRAFTNLTSPATQQAAAVGITAPSVRTFNMELSDETYKHTIDVFQGDFGTLHLHPDVFVGFDSPTAGLDFKATPARGYVIPIEMCELRYAQLPKVQDLPDNGGGPAKLIRAIAGLVVKNPLGFGWWDCNDAVA